MLKLPTIMMSRAILILIEVTNYNDEPSYFDIKVTNYNDEPRHFDIEVTKYDNELSELF